MDWSRFETEPFGRTELNVFEGSESIIPELNERSLMGTLFLRYKPALNNDTARRSVPQL